MRRIEKLILQVRSETDNDDVPSSTEEKGIPDSDFIQFLNDSQDRLQSLIAARYPQVFIREVEIDIVPNQESYTISDRVFLNNRLHTVEFSCTGLVRDYVELEPATVKERYTDTSPDPCYYIRRAGELLLNPIPSRAGGKIRITYERELDDLDIRRGRVASVTGTPITAITLEADLPAPSTLLSGVEVGDYICVCDKDGNVTAYNIPVSSYDSGTRVFTVPSHSLGSGESIVAGSYVTLGRYSSTHSGLPDMCERYLVAYSTLKTLVRDSSEDFTDKNRELSEIESDIIGSFADITRDVDYIAILDESPL